MHFTWRATAAAGRAHPHAQALALTGAVLLRQKQRPRRARSLAPYDDETPASAPGHLHAHAIDRVTVFGAEGEEE